MSWLPSSRSWRHRSGRPPRICAAAVDRLAAAGATVTEATPAWGDPEEAMWNGVWVPGFAAEHDLLDWEAARGTVDDELIELLREGERLRPAHGVPIT